MPTLYRTYRPQTFAEVTAQEHVKKTLQNQLKTGKVAHAYLFTGPRGIGKTTVARLLAKSVNCEKPDKSKKGFEPCNECSMCKETTGGSALDVFEIDAASHTGVDNVRELIDGVRFAPNKGKFKVYIVDEVHMLSTAAFNALLKTLEEPPAHAIFILATTEIHKVPATVVSRCQRFDFRRFTPAEIVSRLKDIAKAEEVKIDEDVLYEIARHSEGCERDAESLLGQLFALGEKEIKLDEASLVLPVAYTETVLKFVEGLAKNDAAAAIRILNEGVEQGMDVPSFLDNVVSLLRTVLFAKLGGLERFQEAYEAGALKRVGSLTETWSVNALTNAIELFLAARRSAKNDAIPQLSAELAAMKICHPEAVTVSSEKKIPPSTPTAPTPPAPLQGEGRGEVRKPTPPVKSEIIIEPPKVTLPTRSISVEEVRSKWNELCQRLEDKNPSLLLILKNADITKITGNQIEVQFAFALHAETVNRGKNKNNIDNLLSDILGTPVSVMATHVPPTAEADEAMSMLSEAFGGQAA
ncbi:MAG: DNA polymerase III subunit gamma/tau [Patescibacteria group bacterium]|jgi:DNA polymerase-3 subunit gamma/tau